jgi:drug/metabolite transporter (DMT)-like permease
MLIGLVGFSIMLIHDAPGETVYCPVGFLSMGEMALIVAAIATVVGWMATRKALQTNLSTATEIIAFGMLYGGIICIAQSLFTENYSIMQGHYSSIACYLLLATIFSSVLGYTLYVYLLQKYTATFLSFAGFFEPFCAAFFGWFFLGEVVTGWFFLAAFFVFVGLYWFYQEELKQGYIVKSR